MPSSTASRTRVEAATGYINFELIRGLTEIILTAGQRIDPFIACQEPFRSTVLKHLLSQDLNYIGLAFLYKGKLIENYGFWFVKINYGAGSDQAMQFPVRAIKEDLLRSGLPPADAYKIYLYFTKGIQIFPENTFVNTPVSGATTTGVRDLGEFGFKPIGAGVYRAKIKLS